MTTDTTRFVRMAPSAGRGALDAEARGLGAARHAYSPSAARLAEADATAKSHSASFRAGFEACAHRMRRRVIGAFIVGALSAGTVAYAAHSLGWLS